ESQAAALAQIRLDEARPLVRDLSRHACVSISWKIAEHYFRMRLPRPAHFEEVDGARASRDRAGPRDLGTEQRVDHARLADVRAAKEGYLWKRGCGKLGCAGGSADELCEDTHSFSFRVPGATCK